MISKPRRSFILKSTSSSSNNKNGNGNSSSSVATRIGAIRRRSSSSSTLSNISSSATTNASGSSSLISGNNSVTFADQQQGEEGTFENNTQSNSSTQNKLTEVMEYENIPIDCHKDCYYTGAELMEIRKQEVISIKEALNQLAAMGRTDRDIESVDLTTNKTTTTNSQSPTTASSSENTSDSSTQTSTQPPQPPHEPQVTWRGIEDYRDGKNRADHARLHSIIVLREWNDQVVAGVCDLEMLRQVSKASSRDDRRAADELADQDATGQGYKLANRGVKRRFSRELTAMTSRIMQLQAKGLRSPSFVSNYSFKNLTTTNNKTTTTTAAAVTGTATSSPTKTTPVNPAPPTVAATPPTAHQVVAATTVMPNAA